MLLISNINQFLDALNSCAVGLFDYSEVVRSAQLSVEDMQEHCPSEGSGVSRQMLEDTPEYSVEVICIDKGEVLSISGDGREEWLYIVDGLLNMDSSQFASQEAIQLKPAPIENRLSNMAEGKTIGIYLKIK